MSTPEEEARPRAERRAELSNKFRPLTNGNIEAINEYVDADDLNQALEYFPDAPYLLYRKKRIDTKKARMARDRFRRWHKAILCSPHNRESALVAARLTGMSWADWVFDFGYPCYISFQRVVRFEDVIFQDSEICDQILTGFKERIRVRHLVQDSPGPMLAETELRLLATEHMSARARNEFANHMLEQQTPPLVPLPRNRHQEIGELARKTMEMDTGR